jgi:hypothetical protein
MSRIDSLTYLLSDFCVPRTVPGVCDTLTNKTGKIICLHGAYFLQVERMINNEGNKLLNYKLNILIQYKYAKF